MAITVKYFKIEHPAKYTRREVPDGEFHFTSEVAATMDIKGMQIKSKAELYSNGKLKITFYKIVYKAKTYLIRVFAKPIKNKIVCEVLVNGEWKDHIGEITYDADIIDLQSSHVRGLNQGFKTEKQARIWAINNLKPGCYANVKSSSLTPFWDGSGFTDMTSHLYSIAEVNGKLNVYKGHYGYVTKSMDGKKHIQYHKIGTINSTGQIIKK